MREVKALQSGNVPCIQEGSAWNGHLGANWDAQAAQEELEDNKL